MPRKKLAEAAHFECSLRRHLSGRDLRRIQSGGPLVRPICGTAAFPGRPSRLDCERNRKVLRAICEVYPDRIPSAHVLAAGISLLDTYLEGKLIGNPQGVHGDGKGEACMAIAFTLKVLTQRLRRLFRRSTNSRPRVIKNDSLRNKTHPH